MYLLERVRFQTSDSFWCNKSSVDVKWGTILMRLCATEDVEYCTLNSTSIVWWVHGEEQIDFFLRDYFRSGWTICLTCIALFNIRSSNIKYVRQLSLQAWCQILSLCVEEKNNLTRPWFCRTANDYLLQKSEKSYPH